MTPTSNTHTRLTASLAATKLTTESLTQAVNYVYETLDAIDAALESRGSEPLAAMVELANLSSMIGNLLRTGVAKFSNGNYRSNGPHKHPDLLHCSNPELNIEIKVALEDNQPKGHLAKPGWHLTCHYVLCAPDGSFTAGTSNRGALPRVWLLRFGHLEIEHFNISNTEGDSGKTAVVNAAGMALLEPIYFSPAICPLPISRQAKKSRRIFEQFDLPYLP